ncbi:hypothetical protein [uncultured Clostridium sp.]|uniref:hypothetical protein n=1 Tax=uncultured Clostridium sp. TaxID=59620 RepID=UPI0026717508|nr:hypothetical protein [uncultured Clostridium sp.]
MKKNIKLFLGVVILIGLGIGVGLTLNFTKDNFIKSSGAIIEDGVISGYTAEEIEAIMQRKADESTFSFEVNSRPIFENGKSEGNLRIYNPPYNKYVIDVEIKLDSNNKTIFKSDKIKPNQYIENAKLNKNLKKGEYEATATINAYDSDGETLIGVSAAKLIITIEN